LDVGNKRIDGKFVAEDGTIPPGEAEISELYDRCIKWSDLVVERYAETLIEHNVFKLTRSCVQKRKRSRTMAPDVRCAGGNSK
jgi:hypothetical protein